MSELKPAKETVVIDPMGALTADTTVSYQIDYSIGNGFGWTKEDLTEGATTQKQIDDQAFHRTRTTPPLIPGDLRVAEGA